MERSRALDKEITKREEDITILESTEGWKLLSEKQRRIIKDLLYIQARAERGNVLAVNFGLADDPYQESRRSNMSRNCHSSVAAVEGGDIGSVRPIQITDGFFDAEYHSVPDFKTVKKITEEFGFPSVVHAASECGNTRGREYKHHSFIILGHHNGDIIVWDKQGYSYPYRVITLNEEYSVYDSYYCWGFRKLKG